MIKKLLILPLIWGLMSFGAFASANTITVDWKSYTSDSEITVKQCSNENDCYAYWDDSPITDYDTPFYTCWILSDIVSWEGGYHFYWLDYEDQSQMSSLNTLYCKVNNQWGSSSYWIFPNDYNEEIRMNWYLLTSDNSITIVSNSSNSSVSSTVFPTIPSSFTSWITNLLSNFGSVIISWLPSIILVAMWIFAIFMLFRVVRNYARSTFQW